MQEQKNIPYVKQYDENGNITNPIKDKYAPEFETRKQRRHKDIRFCNNRKTANIVVFGTRKYNKVLQIEKDKSGNTKYIEHYL